jgi:hypothetical protein
MKHKLEDFNFNGNHTEAELKEFLRWANRHIKFQLGDIVMAPNLDKPFVIDEIFVGNIEWRNVKYCGREVSPITHKPRAKRYNPRRNETVCAGWESGIKLINNLNNIKL